MMLPGSGCGLHRDVDAQALEAARISLPLASAGLRASTLLERLRFEHDRLGR